MEVRPRALAIEERWNNGEIREDYRIGFSTIQLSGRSAKIDASRLTFAIAVTRSAPSLT